jgi:hypothetical protein
MISLVCDHDLAHAAALLAPRSRNHFASALFGWNHNQNQARTTLPVLIPALTKDAIIQMFESGEPL